MNAFSLVASSDSAEFLTFATTLTTLRFCAGVVASVAAGFTGLVPLMWTAAYFSEGAQSKSRRGIRFGAAATISLTVLALWLWDVTRLFFR